MFSKKSLSQHIIVSVFAYASLTLTPAFSEESLISGDIPGSFEGNVSITTDYVFRGISQSQEKPALQAGVKWTHDAGFYVGFWGSSVDYADGDESSTEMDAFIGYSQTIDNFTYDIGFIHYFYPGTNRHLNYDFSEVSLALAYDFNHFVLGASVNYSPQYWGNSGEAFYTAGTINVPVKYGIALDAGIGHQTMQTPSGYGIGNDYTDWHVGLSVPIKDFNLSIQYMDTDLTSDECSDGCEPRVVGNMSYNF